MINAITQNIFYKTTDKIQSNTLLNRGIMDIFGYSIPTALNANNEDEARERIIGSGVYFTIAFLSPLVMMPLFNRFFLKKAGIIDKFSDKGVEIVRLSKKHLVKDSKEMLNGLDELMKDLKTHPLERTRKKFQNVEKDFQPILDKFKGREEELRLKLLKAHTKIAMGDYISTGTMFVMSCFGVRELTKKLTGRTGFSAEYKMADDDYTKNNAHKHERIKIFKILASAAIMLTGSIAANKYIEKSFLSQSPKGLMNRIKNNAEKFNYTDGKFMKLMPYFLITMIGDMPPYFMSARDKYELRDSMVRQFFCMSVFFGGDAVLSGIFGRILDKIAHTKLINKEELKPKANFWKRATAPIYTLEQLRKKTGWDEKLLKRTQKASIAMYWLSLALNILILGTAMPKALNYVLRKSVSKDLKEKEAGQNPLAGFDPPESKFKTIDEFLNRD